MNPIILSLLARLDKAIVVVVVVIIPSLPRIEYGTNGNSDLCRQPN